MSLNAVVYCDDVEKGCLKVPHPLPHLLFVDEAGCPTVSSDDPEDTSKHDQWEAQHPCPHDHFWLAEYWLGNAASIGRVREAVTKRSEDPSCDYPVLWSKVIYSGSHSGDFVKGDEVLKLKDEVGRMRQTYVASPDIEDFLDEFLSKLERLIQCSLSVGKPISF